MSKLFLKKGFALSAVALVLVAGFFVAKGTAKAVDGVQTLTVNVTVSGEGSVSSSPAGINCHADASCSADFSSDVTLTANGYGEHEFYGWTPGACDSEDEYTCTINLGDSSRTVDVSLDFGITFNMNINVEGNGTVTSTPSGQICPTVICSFNVPSGPVALTATPGSGAVFSGWSGDCLSFGTTPLCTLTVPPSRSVTATFEDAPIPAPATGPWYVSFAIGNDTNDCNTVEAPCKTIQAAINKASAGDTVNVAAGVYAEHITINKALTLNGANSEVACRATRSTESVITGDASGAVQILADDVTLNGFQISSSENALGSGIWTDDSGLVSGYQVKNNLISQSQIGMAANSNGTSTISCNIFDGNNEPGSAGGSGIYSANTDNLTIDDNEFKNHLTNNPLIFAVNETAPSHEDLTFSNNLVHDNAYGLYILGVNNGSFTDNDISAAIDSTAISFAGGSSNVTVTGNTIHNSLRGIRFENGEYPCCGPDTNIDINLNAITGNSEYGVGNIALGHTSPVDATCNWWGNASGPGVVGPGTGDKVTSDVTFTSWLTSDDISDCNNDEPSSGGGSGRSSRSTANPSGGGSVLGASTEGQVLGAEKFIFTLFLKMGPPYKMSIQGNEVMELQKFLNATGYGILEVDGKFGKKTKVAVIKFQLANGLKGDGIVGPLTRAVLNK